MRRRHIATVLMLAALLAAPATRAAEGDAVRSEQLAVGPDDRVLGDRDAPRTIIEYASLTCSHCREFHTATLPQLKAAYIDTGKAKLVFRDFPLDRLALAGAMLARCADDEEKSLEVVGTLFENQPQWIQTDDPVAALAGQVSSIGMSREAVDACLSNETVARTVVAQAKAGQEAFSIDSTPTFIVDGEMIEGALSFEAFDEHLKQTHE